MLAPNPLTGSQSTTDASSTPAAPSPAPRRDRRSRPGPAQPDIARTARTVASSRHGSGRTRIRELERVEAANQEGGADEQGHRERGLEPMSAARPRPRRGSRRQPRARPAGRPHVWPRRRSPARTRSCTQREEDAEQEGPRPDADLRRRGTPAAVAAPTSRSRAHQRGPRRRRAGRRRGSPRRSVERSWRGWRQVPGGWRTRAAAPARRR